MPVGVVKWFSEGKGYGFITPDVGGGGHLFVHATGIKGTGRQSLQEGQRVEFEIIQGPKGPQAGNVTPIPGGSPQLEPQRAAPRERGRTRRPRDRFPAEAPRDRLSASRTTPVQPKVNASTVRRYPDPVPEQKDDERWQGICPSESAS
jgi:CspA family cold shock protein